MTIFLKTTLIILLSSQVVFAQQKRKLVLRSNSNKVSSKEGNSTYIDHWTLSPELRPDVFVSKPIDKTQEIIFFSKIDTLSLWVRANERYDFVIVNGKDCAHTQISTYTNEKPTLRPKPSYKKTRNQDGRPDTLNFRLGQDKGIL